MKNRYTIFLLHLSIAIIAFICVTQVYALIQFHDASGAEAGGSTYSQFRFIQAVTFLLSAAAIAILFSREEINRGIKQKAYTDITGIMNKHACFEQMNILDCNESTANVGFAMFDLNNLKKVNDFYGHEEGDKLIQSFVVLLRQAADRKYFLGRFGGDEFIAIIENCTESIMEAFMERLRNSVQTFNEGCSIQLSYACGYAISTQEHYYLMDELLKEADKKMYEHKKKIKSKGLLETEQVSKILDLERRNPLEKDALTGMLNLDTFVSVVGSVLKNSVQNARYAIVCSDIYNFRYINDFCGHEEADNMLKRFSADLSNQSACLACCRIHSDNFAFLADMPQNSDEEGVDLIRQWNTEFSYMMSHNHNFDRLIVKSGIYFITDPNEPVQLMINNADCARKYTKATYQNIFVYSKDLSEAIRKRAEIIHSFQRGLEEKEFQVYVQPKVLCSDKSICGAEALIRWLRQDGNFIYPDEFIPVLEQTGDILDLDFYVYEKVFSYLHERYQAGKALIPISVNVSRIHLTKAGEFISYVQELQKRYPIPTSCIVFELTESAYIQEIDTAHLFIEQLRDLHYKVSMDDFGSGYSSLKSLQTMPFDEIKFDQTFLRESVEQKDHSLLVQLIQLVKKLNVTIVCEGVETSDNVNLLEQTECDVMQGYYYSKPFPLSKLDTCVME